MREHDQKPFTDAQLKAYDEALAQSLRLEEERAAAEKKAFLDELDEINERDAEHQRDYN